MQVIACKKINVFFSIIFIACVASKTFATSSTWQPNQNTWFAGIGGGKTDISLPTYTTVLNGAMVPPPNNYDRYTIKDPTTSNFQLFVGHRWQQETRFLPYYSAMLRYTHYFGTNIKGQVEQYSLPEFLNYNYRVNYEADSFMLMGKFNLIQYKQILPYFAAGIGFIINHLNDYNETAIPPVTPRTSPGYGGNSSTSGAFALGAGIDFILTDTYWLTLGYEHIFQGDINTNPGTGSWSGTTLKIGNVKMDTLFLNLSVNFPDTFWR